MPFEKSYSSLIAIHVDAVDIAVLESRGDIGAFDLVVALDGVLGDDEGIAFLQHPIHVVVFELNVDIGTRQLTVLGPKDGCHAHLND